MVRTGFLLAGLAFFSIALVAIAAPPAGPSSNSSVEAHIRYPECLVQLIKRCDVLVPAQEAGMLVSLEAHEGMSVEAGATLAQVDDSQVQMKKMVAEAEFKVAKAEAENTVDILFNEAAAGAAQMEYQLNKQALEKSANVISKVEMEELRLKWRKAWLGIKQAEVKQGTNKLTADAREVEVKAADNDIARRKIVAPLSGEVAEIYAGAGEWVNPGSRVLRLVQMDKLQVEGFLNLKEFAPDQVAGRAVKIVAHVGPDRVEEFQGKVVFIDPLLKAGKFRVVAEVVNRRAEGDGPWLLRHGMQPEEMIIDALAGKSPGGAAQRSAAGPR